MSQRDFLCMEETKLLFIYSKSTMETTQQRHSGVFIVYFEQTQLIVLFSLLPLYKYMPAGYIYIQVYKYISLI